MNRFVILQKERDQQFVLYWCLSPRPRPVAGETIDPLLDAYPSG